MHSTRHAHSTRCTNCGDDVPSGRSQLGYTTCLDCGDKIARRARTYWVTAPINKSNYMLITNPDELKQLNPKRSGD